MVEENINQEFRLKNIDEPKNYFLEKIRQNELICRKCKNVCAVLNYIEHLLILASAITGCISISGFPFLLGISVEITSSEIGLIICVITTGLVNNSISQ